jgi:hypothetical protein
MNAVVSSLWEHLCRYDADQRRFLRACLGREADPVMPFAGPVTTVRAAPWSGAVLPPEAMRISYVASDGAEHAEAVLGRADLLALGIGPWIFQFGSEALLADLLAAMQPDGLRRASRLLGAEVTLRVQRLASHQALPELPWSSFVAEAVPLLGRLRFRLSPALIDACEAHPMPRRNPGGMRHIPLMWDVRLGCIGLQRKDCEGLANGDVVRVLLSPVPEAEVVGSLVPHSAGFSLAHGGGRPRARRWVKVLIDRGGWISLRFEPQDKQAEYEMDDDDKLDGAIVPVNLTLPVAAMSLHEIDSVKPGTLVDTGVRLQDVEVALWSAGYRFATGRLVVIGEHLGVEIGRTERDLP